MKASARALRLRDAISRSSFRRATKAALEKSLPLSSDRNDLARVDSSKERAASPESISVMERKEREVASAARVASLRMVLLLLRPLTRTSKATGLRVATLSWVSSLEFLNYHR